MWSLVNKVFQLDGGIESFGLVGCWTGYQVFRKKKTGKINEY